MARHRILVAGLFHETNTFVEDTTGLEAFEWVEGPDLLAMRDDGSPTAGVIRTGELYDWEILPAIDCRAMPSGTVSREVFDRYWAALRGYLERARSSGLDGIAFVFHGAMAVEGMQDPEGAILSAIRALPGFAHLPIVGVLDLHANVSQEMASLANGWIAYRENPHTDGFASGMRAGEMLEQILASRKPARSVYLHSRLLIPPPGTGTGLSPFREIEQLARNLESRYEEFLAVNIVPGFAHADVADVGTTFIVTTTGNQDKAHEALQILNHALWESKAPAFPQEWDLEEAIDAARSGETPALLVEPADNIGGGAPGDGTVVLRGLLEAQVPHSAVAINDPAAVDILRRHDIGAKLSLELGGKGSRLDPGPVLTEVELIHLSDGKFRLEDPQSHLSSMYGQNFRMGDTAVVRAGELTILLTSNKTPPFDLGMWRSQRLNPEDFSLVGIKAAVAHKRAWDKITKQSYTVDVPGPCSSNLRNLPYRNIRRPIYPLDEGVSS